jgi:outer membrane protein TolC
MRRFAAPLCVLVLAGCTVGPNYRPPEAGALSVPDTYYQRPAGVVRPADLARWWERFDDPLLTRLIDEATAGNLDLAVASARLVQARESLVQAQAGLVPTVGATAGAGRNFGPGNDRSSFSAGADAAWEADLFGRIRRGIEAARADAEGSFYDREALRVAIAAEVATN